MEQDTGVQKYIFRELIWFQIDSHDLETNNTMITLINYKDGEGNGGYCRVGDDVRNFFYRRHRLPIIRNINDMHTSFS